jgi:ribose transport system ATP-binding protein
MVGMTQDQVAAAARPEPGGGPLLRMTGISKRFPGVVALQDVSLEVFPGECLALVGENGAGKSTLMKILSGVYAPDEGEIALNGQPVALQSPRQAQDLGISIIYQEFNLMPNLTVAETSSSAASRTRAASSGSPRWSGRRRRCSTSSGCGCGRTRSCVT